jgi:putative transposase
MSDPKKVTIFCYGGCGRTVTQGRCRDSFYVANDKLSLDGKTISLPKIGEVALAEVLRFKGKILGATVSRAADRWFVAVQGEVPDAQFYRRRTSHEVNGVDLGVKAAVAISNGEFIEAPKPLKDALRRLKIRGRRVSRKLEAAKKVAGFGRHARLPVSNNRQKSAATLARLHARAISDVGFGMFRSQMEYKAKRYGTRLVIWYPSGRLCSVCGWKNETLTLRDREWSCGECGAHHDRDINAALNLKRLATETALPVASPSSNGGAMAGMVPIIVGKITPVRYECGQQDTSGQEGNRAHLCALS